MEVREIELFTLFNMTLHRISVFSFREVPNQKTTVKYLKEDNLQYVSIKLHNRALNFRHVQFRIFSWKEAALDSHLVHKLLHSAINFIISGSRNLGRG